MDVEKQRFSVTLKPSLTASADASFLHGLLRCVILKGIHKGGIHKARNSIQGGV